MECLINDDSHIGDKYGLVSWIWNDMCAVVVESNWKFYLNLIENSESNLIVKSE